MQAQSRNACYSVSCYVRLIAEAREQLVLYAVPGSVSPADSLLDKFRRLCIEMKSSTRAPQDTAVSLKA